MIRFCLAILCFAVVAGSSGPVLAAACSPGIPCTGYARDNGDTDVHIRPQETYCNADVMNQIVARAFLEAQREQLVNQTHIRKADSVLEYSCFEDIVDAAVSDAAPLFSETNEFAFRIIPLYHIFADAADGLPWNNFPIAILNVAMVPGHMSSRMNNVVSQPLQQYLSGSFGHSFLGDAIGGSTTCGNMADIYESAKCMNIESDAFMEFEDLVSTDPRQLPSACTGGTGITNDIIQVARNPVPATPGANIDPLVVYWEMFELDDGDTCQAAPIRIGLQATIYTATGSTPDPATNPAGVTMSEDTVEEHVCTNPGCWYDPDTGECEM